MAIHPGAGTEITLAQSLRRLVQEQGCFAAMPRDRSTCGRIRARRLPSASSRVWWHRTRSGPQSGRHDEYQHNLTDFATLPILG